MYAYEIIDNDVDNDYDDNNEICICIYAASKLYIHLYILFIYHCIRVIIEVIQNKENFTKITYVK